MVSIDLVETCLDMVVPRLKLVERVFEVAREILKPAGQKLIPFTVGELLGHSEIA